MSIINHGTRELLWLDVSLVEKTYKAKYVGEFCIKTKSGWSEEPVAVFYQPVRTDPSHSDYFGVFARDSNVLLCDASSTTNIPIIGLESGGEIIYSRFRHDYRGTTDGLATIDGGRDYCKRSGAAKEVILAILDGELQIVENPDEMFVQLKLTDAN